MCPVTRADLDTLYKIVSKKRRQAVIATLLQTSDEIHLEKLISQFETDQTESVGIEGPNQEQKRVEIELIHQHLPMLHNAGFIEFDQSRRSISPRNSLKQFEKIVPDLAKG